MKNIIRKLFLGFLMLAIGGSQVALADFVPFDPNKPFSSTGRNIVELMAAGIEVGARCAGETASAGMESIALLNKYRYFTGLLCICGMYYYICGQERPRERGRDGRARHCDACLHHGRGLHCPGVAAR